MATAFIPTTIPTALPSSKILPTPTDRPLTFLITGCSSGLGLALARAVQAAGHKLIATSRNPSRTPELISEIESHKSGGRWLALDVDKPDCGRIIDELEAEEGTQIDVLVNNAGWSVHGAVELLEDDEVRDQFETVFFGPLRLCRAAVGYMRKRRFGVVINVSSGAGIEGRESMGAYAAAKSALDAISKVLYKEVAEFNVRVLTVHLGSFRTNMGNVVRKGRVPFPEDYRDTVVGKTVDFMGAGKFSGDGDPEKAAKVIVDVATGKKGTVGEGREVEIILPLGREMVPRYKLLRDRLDHAIKVFGEVAGSVAADPSKPF